MRRSLLPVMTTALMLVMAFATSSSFAAGGTTNKQLVRKVSLQSNGYVYVYGTKAWTNKGNCNSNTYAVLKPTHKFYRETYATLLVARAQQIEVSLKVNGCVLVSGKSRQLIKGVNM